MPIAEGLVGIPHPSGQGIIPPQIGLIQRGPVLPVFLTVPRAVAEALTKANRPIPAPVNGLALIDTGAGGTCVDEAAMAQLGIFSHGKGSTHGVGGKTERPKFACMLHISPQIGPHAPIFLPDTLGAPLQGLGYIALLGRDFLQDKVLEYHGMTGGFTVAW